MKGKTVFPCFKLILLYGLLCLMLLLSQQTAQADSAVRFYDIPAGPLSTAIYQLAETGGIQAIYDAIVTQGMVSKGLKGNYTTEQALEKLLAGTGLVYTLSDGAITIKATNNATKPSSPSANSGPSNQDTQSAITLPKVNVVGNAVYDVKDPYNTDYVLPNATAGTKTDTPILETPLNVQVVSKQVLKDQQVITLGQALKNVSGVTTGTNSDDTGFGGPEQAITLRGFTSSTYFRNGFRLQQGVATREMANVESVEVLKGPAAILYGLVEPGGMVNVNTKKPLATPYYSLQQQFGSYDLYRTTGDASGPFAQNSDLLYRVNLSYENSGSFREFVQNEKVFFAPVLTWNISSRTQATLELEYNHGNLGQDSQFAPLLNSQFIHIPRSRNYGEPAKIVNDSIFGGFNWSHQFNDDWSVKHRFSVNQQGNSSVNVIPLTPGFSADPTQIDRILSLYNSQNNTYSTNIDLTGHFTTAGIQHTVLLGGDYYRMDSAFYGMSNTVGITDTMIDVYNPVHTNVFGGMTLDPSTRYSNASHTDQYGIYLQDQMKLPYNFHFTGGFRYQNIHQKGYHQSPFWGSEPRQDPTLTADAVTPRVGLLWQAQNWLSLYSNYAENFGANPAKIYPGIAAPPTSAQQWEIGAKTEFFDGRLRATLAYYDLTKQNVATADPDINLANQGFSRVTGAVRSKGPELDIQGEVVPGWNVIATYSNTDIRVTKSNDSYPAVGSRFYGVPRNMGSLWNTYDFQHEGLRGFKIGGGVTLRDAQLAFSALNPNLTLPGYATVDLLAAYSQKVGKTKITAQLNVNNLLDKYYLSYATVPYFPSSAGFDGAFVNFGAPRSVMGSLKIEY